MASKHLMHGHTAGNGCPDKQATSRCQAQAISLGLWGSLAAERGHAAAGEGWQIKALASRPDGSAEGHDVGCSSVVARGRKTCMFTFCFELVHEVYARWRPTDGKSMLFVPSFGSQIHCPMYHQIRTLD